MTRPQVYRLALADLLHDRLVSFCQLALLVALFSPLLLLFSLKYGIVTDLLDDLSSNPETLAPAGPSAPITCRRISSPPCARGPMSASSSPRPAPSRRRSISAESLAPRRPHPRPTSR